MENLQPIGLNTYHSHGRHKEVERTTSRSSKKPLSTIDKSNESTLLSSSQFAADTAVKLGQIQRGQLNIIQTRTSINAGDNPESEFVIGGADDRTVVDAYQAICLDHTAPFTSIEERKVAMAFVREENIPSISGAPEPFYQVNSSYPDSNDIVDFEPIEDAVSNPFNSVRGELSLCDYLEYQVAKEPEQNGVNALINGFRFLSSNQDGDVELVARRILERLMGFLKDFNGPDKTEMNKITVSYQGIEKHSNIVATAMFHVFENFKSHLNNVHATTSESQVLFVKFLALYGILTNNYSHMKEAYNYLVYFMMPGDGRSSTVLPDAKLDVIQPTLIHWLVQAGDFSQVSAYPSEFPFFKNNQTYDIYQGVKPTMVLDADGNFDTSKRILGQTHIFSDATDYTLELVTALSLVLGIDTGTGIKIEEEINRMRSTFVQDGTADPRITVSLATGKYAGANIFSKVSAGNIIDGTSEYSDVNILYVGYQNLSALYDYIGDINNAQIKNVLKLIKDSQLEFTKQFDSTGSLGNKTAFMPVFDVDTDSFSWDGPDPNTNWAGFQYRTFARLAEYYRKSHDPEALEIMAKFYGWLNIDFENPENTKVARYVDRETGAGSDFRFDANNSALLAQAFVELAIGFQNDPNNPALAEIAPIMIKHAEGFIKQIAGHQKDNGSFTTKEDAGGVKIRKITYGYTQSEVGIAMTKYLIYEKYFNRPVVDVINP